MMRSSLRTIATLAVTLLAACGGKSGFADGKYPGETLLTVRGQLASSNAAAAQGPVAMAILWSPTWAPLAPSSIPLPVSHR